ncbi:ATP-dependent DNA helicase PIF1 [Cyphomyrmex costatus]|uniref:ATP-dependent DNA helicase n=1 Tax=Cyphomyrmex costatus TaxID=456900 RepID=A0A151ILJ3_9HYME|nr:ATP-dependent DNA helicase PIF1 [Cyphomyrmex costatus]
MRDFKDVGDKYEVNNVDEMIAQLNSDQKRIFDKVTASILSNSENLRLYISGEGGTGKSFLIKTIRSWIKKYVEKDTAITAPTGIAAFNIDGLTIHRLFQLPVEHGRTAKYKQLSDVVLKFIREELKNVALIIIDEVSMISNITLMYIHLRLTEIFNTDESDNGWFGEKHILLFGDLLQLPPVHEEPPFIELSTTKIEKYVGGMGSMNLWSLFKYDELQINMRQQNDNSYRNILSRIRLGIVTDSDTAVLNARKIQFTETTCDGRLYELCNYLEKLPLDTVCLLPTCALCDTLNTAMLNRIFSDEVELIAQDITDCVPYLKKKISKILSKNDEDSSRTAGLAKIIIVKLGARIMIRRNIDVTLGLVNGAIGTITSFIRNNNEIDKIKIIVSGVEHVLERVSVKFEVMDRAYVIRKQFPICLSYGMTIHKSQGLSLKYAIVEAGNSIFSCGQVYVALSRVTNLNGLYLINYDPSSVKANELAIIEYNRLRLQYRPDLLNINISKQHVQKVHDLQWALSKNILECQIKNKDDIDYTLWCLTGLPNTDNVSCYANASLQCIFHSPTLRTSLFQLEYTNIMRKLIESYANNKNNIIMQTIKLI